eukprot:CAMPEP_0113850768 /NCGR_PEP_ID=MMETSP0372-20130328/4132_1 /TAXON_ID=340204 /ORGANISM="Lankesteria abbotti" /LENGTH=76 /DNA_ID=CAMNT_0000821231 /DNA_START=100 /DNA_END=330 /DNA_ORIENTATION=+ /assembly_acc=CAM_ASM_000359
MEDSGLCSMDGVDMRRHGNKLSMQIRERHGSQRTEALNCDKKGSEQTILREVMPKRRSMKRKAMRRYYRLLHMKQT